MTFWRVCLLAFVLLGRATLHAQTTEENIGQIKTLTGDVHIVRGQQQQVAQAGDLLHQDDTLVTGAESSVGLTLIDNTRFSAGPNSRFALKEFRFNPTTQDGASVTEVQRGTLAVISGSIAKRSPEAMKVKTPTTILGVRGTRFLVQVKE